MCAEIDGEGLRAPRGESGGRGGGESGGRGSIGEPGPMLPSTPVSSRSWDKVVPRRVGGRVSDGEGGRSLGKRGGRALVASLEVPDLLTLGGRKFDNRVFVLVASAEPLVRFTLNLNPKP